MRSLPVSFVFVLPCCASRVPAQSRLKRLLRPVDAFRDDRIRDGKVETVEPLDTGCCLGAFALVQSAIRTDVVLKNGRSSQTVSAYGICDPSSVTRTQLIAVFLGYLAKNPRRLSDEFFDVVIDALRELYLCRGDAADGARRRW